MWKDTMVGTRGVIGDAKAGALGLDLVLCLCIEVKSWKQSILEGPSGSERQKMWVLAARQA